MLSSPCPGQTTEMVPIAEIDLADRRFQLRAEDVTGDLYESLSANGQQTPVLLWGVGGRPYRVIDGFRRIHALSAKGSPAVLAIVRKDLDQTQALAVSFLTNSQRRNLSPLDKACAVWRALNEFEMAKPMVASLLGLSQRQIDRYLEALRFEPPVREALHSNRITLRHASVLHRYRVREPTLWIHAIKKEKLSANTLEAGLKRSHRARRRWDLVRCEPWGFRFAGFQLRWEMSEDEKARIRDALEHALALMDAGASRDGSPGLEHAHSAPLRAVDDRRLVSSA